MAVVAVAAVVDRGQPESTTSSPATALSPAVRRIVDEEKLDPAKISGTGKGGRITKGDALAATQNRDAAERTDTEARTATEVAGPVDSLAPAAQDGRVVRKKMSPLRRKIAQQLVMAQHTAAILTTFNECDMSEVQALRAHAQEQFTKKNGLKLGFMSFFTKAVTRALQLYPDVNASIASTPIERYVCATGQLFTRSHGSPEEHPDASPDTAATRRFP